MRLLVCGSRNLGAESLQFMARTILAAANPDLHLVPRFTLIHGDGPPGSRPGAIGADKLSELAALLSTQGEELSIKRFPAAWKLHGPKAGPLRNQQMLDEGKPDLVLAFHTDPSLGRGTADMVRRARNAGVTVEVHILGGES